MDRDFRKKAVPDGTNESLPTEAWLFAQLLLGKPIPSVTKAESEARRKREQLEWLARISTEHEQELRRVLSAEAEARRQRERLEWLAQISTEHERKLRTLLREEADAREARELLKRYAERSTVQEAGWDPAKHPKLGGPPNAGWWATTSGSGSASAAKSPSFLDAIVRRNQAVSGLTGMVTPGMIRSSRLAVELQSAARLPGEVARAAAAGLGTGGKAVVNGSVTAIKNVATLGLSSSQLELISVTKEDRARGYDTAVAISTASGQVLIAVGTGGLTSALSKGGLIARAASGALLAFDSAGNAVGVVQGTYDATQNGVTVSNGTQVAAGVLGLGANLNAARGLHSANLLPKGFDLVKGFATFEDFKDAVGAAGPGQAWHHVVEQTINSGKFAPEILHNPANLLRLPHGKGTIHAKISGYYSTRPRFAEGLTVRQWLSKKSFKEQFEFGIQKIKEFGGTQYLPPHLR